MANESVTVDFVRQHRERSPYERLRTKINGVQAVAVLANTCVDEDAGITDLVWSPLWYFIAEVCDEMKADADEFWAESHPQAKRA